MMSSGSALSGLVFCLLASAALAAGVYPIEDNPVPSWASDTDVCKDISTCDRCPATETRYCSYQDSGRAACCVGKGAAAAAGASATDADSQAETEAANAPLVASIVPIQDDKPEWASANDVCANVPTCDRCQMGQSSYCFYLESGQGVCCQRSASDDVESGSSDSPTPDDSFIDASAPLLMASVGPIEDDPIPEWAAATDSCKHTRSCDICQPSSTQYCHYLESGNAHCCQRSEIAASSEAESESKSVSASSSLNEEAKFVASVGPIVEDPIPEWASNSDSCLTVRSCDHCAVNGQRYCKYTDQGKPQCCRAR